MATKDKNHEIKSEAFTKLSELIVEQQSNTSFACGGIISIHADKSSPSAPCVTTPEQPMSSRPVSVFWSPKEKNEAYVVELPGESAGVEKLAADCSPASFGKGGKDVLDESYRRAGKLDLKEFASNFHPSDFGIVRNIEQVLLPSILSDKDNQLQFRSLVADLYKLNVYSGPSGHFKAHVDTPRSTTQWAAFYSDCEHEIKEVTDGHRITLTYNLHVVDVVGGAILPKSIVDPKTLPLFGLVQSLLNDESFMSKERRVGIYCAHVYAHTSKYANERLPQCLKGSDLVIYSVFKQLGYSVSVLPVMPRHGAIGTELHAECVGDLCETEEEVMSDWPHKRIHPATLWLNSPKHHESAMVYPSYGNEADVDFMYSYAAIMVKTPSERNTK